MPARQWLSAGIVAGVVMLGAMLSGCTGHAAVANGPQNGDQGYISPDGTIRVISPDRREPAPPIHGASLRGSVLDVRNFVGDVVVVNFWASWCPPCRMEQTHLNEVYAAEKSKGVAFLGIDIRDQDAQARAFLSTHRVGYDSIIDNTGTIALGFHPQIPGTPPTTVVLDRSGRVAARIIGAAPPGVLQPIVDQLAREQS